MAAKSSVFGCRIRDVRKAPAAAPATRPLASSFLLGVGRRAGFVCKFVKSVLNSMKRETVVLETEANAGGRPSFQVISHAPGHWDGSVIVKIPTGNLKRLTQHRCWAAQRPRLPCNVSIVLSGADTGHDRVRDGTYWVHLLGRWRCDPSKRRNLRSIS